MDSSHIVYPIAMVGTTTQSYKLLRPLCKDLRGILYVPEKLSLIDKETLYYKSPLKKHLADIFFNTSLFDSTRFLLLLQELNTIKKRNKQLIILILYLVIFKFHFVF